MIIETFIAAGLGAGAPAIASPESVAFMLPQCYTMYVTMVPDALTTHRPEKALTSVRGPKGL